MASSYEILPFHVFAKTTRSGLRGVVSEHSGSNCARTAAARRFAAMTAKSSACPQRPGHNPPPAHESPGENQGAATRPELKGPKQPLSSICCLYLPCYL